MKWSTSTVLFLISTIAGCRDAFAIDVDPPVCNAPRDSRNLQADAVEPMNGSDFCDPPCGDLQFCGSNGVCFENTCLSYYLYGNTNFTGVSDGTSIPVLECEDIDSFEKTSPMSVIFGCATIGCSSSSEDELNSLPYNRVCMAEPQPLVEFICYEFTMDKTKLDNDIALFLVNTKGSVGTHCEQGQPPSYLYSVRVNHIENGTTTTATGNGAISDAFNATLALGTIHTVLRTADPVTLAPTTTPAPNTTVTTPAPNNLSAPTPAPEPAAPTLPESTSMAVMTTTSAVAAGLALTVLWNSMW
jgi:hypothetical protein